MTMTAKYCSKCSGRLSFGTSKTECEAQYYWASLRRHGAVSQEGTCDKCGRDEIVTLYRTELI
jgi:hypothetical protein